MVFVMERIRIGLEPEVGVKRGCVCDRHRCPQFFSRSPMPMGMTVRGRYFKNNEVPEQHSGQDTRLQAMEYKRMEKLTWGFKAIRHELGL